MAVALHVVDHPVVADALSRLRSVDAPNSTFRRELDRIGMVLLTSATTRLTTLTVSVRTPLASTTGRRLDLPPLVVPVLRAGLGFMSAAQYLLPDSDIGFIGLARDEQTHQPVPYSTKLPEQLLGRTCIVLDPMLATGGSLAHTCRLLVERGADPTIVVVCAIAAPEGLGSLDRASTEGGYDVEVHTAAVDERLDANAFIVPGLGDAGDRLFGPPE